MIFSKTALRPAVAVLSFLSLTIGLISFTPSGISAQIRRERPPEKETTETLTGSKAVESLRNSGGYDSLKDAFLKASGGSTGAENLLPTGSYEEVGITASDGASNDYFGVGVSVSGDTAVIGADGAVTSKGAAYVFTRSGTTWTPQQKLTASDSATSDFFGSSVSISGDTTAVGAPGANSSKGAAYVFTRSGTTWNLQRKLTASDGAAGDQFGWSVAVSADTAIVGANVPPPPFLTFAPATGSAYMYYWGPMTPTAAGSRLSGRVLAADGRGLRNAMVVVTDSAGVERTVQTGTFGNFTFNDLPSGDTYVLSVRSRLYQFAPQVVHVAADLDGLRLQPSGSRR